VIAIQDVSTGIPRLINAVCENALILGFAQGQRTIDAAIITAVAADLHLTNARETIVTANPVREIPAVNERNERVDEAASMPVNTQQTTIQQTAMPTLERYTPRRGWRVLFGLD
jgi:hypothetical protein